MPEFAVVIAAAGSSTRFGGGRSKLLEMIGESTVLARSVEAFSSRGDVKCIVVAGSAGIRSQLPASAVLRSCEGGACRAESVLRGLREVPSNIEWVAVHDAARPLVSQELIDRTLAAAVEHGAAAPAMGLVQTVRQIEGALPGASMGVLRRDKLAAMQTPQIARRRELLEAFESCPMPLDQVTDDVQILELAGRSLWLVLGEEGNLKITTPMDLMVARSLIGSGGV